MLGGNLRGSSMARLFQKKTAFDDDEVLARVNNGETFATMLEALKKLAEVGIKRSVMILNGLGGQTLGNSMR